MARDPSVGPVSVGYTKGEITTVNQPGSNVDTVPNPGTVTIMEPRSTKVIILAGGRGTRIHDVTSDLIPKPMLPVGGKPMLEHIIRGYAVQGFTEFIIAAGHLGEQIEEWLAGDGGNIAAVANVHVEHTGIETQTGGRLAACLHLIEEDYFMATYGDGLSDVNLSALLEVHERRQAGNSQGIVTLTAARPPARFGSLKVVDSLVTEFGEKVQINEGWINSGFYTIDTSVVAKLVAGPASRFEYDVLPLLASQGRLAALQHPGFFQCVDTWRDWQLVNQMWNSGEPPWARWE